MPTCKREGFDMAEWNDNNETFQDHEKVFCCLTTKRIFRDYEKYFRHVMLINSTIWQCEATGRDNLTYEEAKRSERVARKKMEQFKDCLRPPVMLVIEHAKQSAIKTLNGIIFKFLRRRYFLNEEVTITGQKKPTLYKVVDMKPSKGTVSAEEVYDDTESLQYRLRPVDSNDVKTEIIVPFDKIRRTRTDFTMDNMQMFVKNNVTRIEGILRPKNESYKRYVLDRNITFSSIFIGKMPRYTPAKIKKPSESTSGKAKQSSINKYLVKNGEPEDKKISKEQKEKAAQERAKTLQEEMERVRREKQEKVLQKEREKAEKRAKLMERIETECTELLTKTDDLERADQRKLPTYTPIRTLVPTKWLGDAFMLREFMHSFSGILSGINVFRNNLSYFEMSRAFTTREVAGPLSDILLVLLGTIFDLQKEEEEECPVAYRTGAIKDREPYISMGNAARSHFYAERHFSFRINQLPLDALTLSEVLRLHLLSSGSFVSDRAEKWRIMYRNGYSSVEDPGFDLRMRHSHILRSLKMYPIYHFPMGDIMRVIRCLMAQILTYSGAINVIEERMEESAKSRSEIKLLVLAENRRVAAVDAQRRKMTNEHNQQCMSDEIKNDESKKNELTEKLNKKVAELVAKSDWEHRKHIQQLQKLNTALFNFLVYIGMDRAYRKYYVFESMPGIFIEHAPDSLDTCLEHPPVNKVGTDIKSYSNLPSNRKDLRSYLLRMYTDEEKKKSKVVTKQSQENKENQEHRVNGLLNGTQEAGASTRSVVNGFEKMEVVEGDETPPSQYQLFMCSGDKHNCIVHSEVNANRQRWTYIYKSEDIDALIDSLNPLGVRESELRQQLKTLRTLIEKHVAKCPYDLLTIDDKVRDKYFGIMKAETHRKYNNANFGLSESLDLNEVMAANLIDSILEFENKIYNGDLGRLKVKDMEKWRNDLQNNTYDPQVKIQWGPSHFAKQCTDGSKSDSEEDSSDDDVDNETEVRETFKYAKKPYRDPGENLGPTLDVDSEDSADDAIPMHESETVCANVRNLASALLQVEQAIEKRFLKPPFAVATRESNKERMESKQRLCIQRLKQWELSLMESTSYSQVYLHLNILNDCIMWARSTTKSLCGVCRRGTDPEKMLLCDECNGGTHMFCMKPKMKTVPEGNWYCRRCVNRLGLKNETEDNKKKPTTSRKRKFIVGEEEPECEEDEQVDEDVDDISETSSVSSKSKAKRSSGRRSQKRLRSKEIEEALDSEDEEVEGQEMDDEDEQLANGHGSDGEEAEEENGEEENDSNVEEDDEEETVCMVCSYDGSDLTCARCKESFHMECVNLKRQPRHEYICQSCKQNESKKSRSRQNNIESEDDDDSDEPLAKKQRGSRFSLRNSLTNADSSKNNNNNNNSNNNNNNQRRSNRRTNENLPLNSSALYELLEQTMKHKLAWPFLRPVMQSEVPDYHQIIKNPMDLAKVKSKLNMGKYQLNEEVLNDIQLVFRNCHEYNEENNEIYNAGSTLERFVIECCKDLHLSFRPSEMNAVI